MEIGNSWSFPNWTNKQCSAFCRGVSPATKIGITCFSITIGTKYLASCGFSRFIFSMPLFIPFCLLGEPPKICNPQDPCHRGYARIWSPFVFPKGIMENRIGQSSMLKPPKRLSCTSIRVPGQLQPRYHAVRGVHASAAPRSAFDAGGIGCAPFLRHQGKPIKKPLVDVDWGVRFTPTFMNPSLFVGGCPWVERGKPTPLEGNHPYQTGVGSCGVKIRGHPFAVIRG